MNLLRCDNATLVTGRGTAPRISRQAPCPAARSCHCSRNAGCGDRIFPDTGFAERRRLPRAGRRRVPPRGGGPGRRNRRCRCRRVLAAELVAHERAVEQVVPALALGFGHVAAAVGGAFALVGVSPPCCSGVVVWLCLQ